MLKTDSGYQLLQKYARIADITEVDAIADCLADPHFEDAEKTHDWRNHVPDFVKSQWPRLCDQARVVAFSMANDEADAEEWD